MTWEYRVIRHVHGTGDELFQIHIVHYDTQGNPQSCSHSCSFPTGKTTEELSHSLIYQLSALTKPVLDYTIFNTDTDVVKTTDIAINSMKKKS